MKIIHNKFDNYKGIAIQNGKRYFFKKNNNDGVEIIYKKIADGFGINCADYKIVQASSVQYYVSPDIGNEGTFTTADELGIDGRKLSRIKSGFERLFPMDKERLFYDLMKVYVLDLLLMNFDRSELNWGILNKDTIPEIYIFDNELALSMSSCYISCREHKPYEQININNDEDEIKEFLEVASQEYKDMLRSMYDLVTPAYLESIIEETEKELGREIDGREDLMKDFKAHFERIGKLIKQPRLSLNYIQ